MAPRLELLYLGGVFTNQDLRTLTLSRPEAFELLAALELSPLDHEVLEQKVLDLVYEDSERVAA